MRCSLALIVFLLPVHLCLQNSSANASVSNVDPAPTNGINPGPKSLYVPPPDEPVEDPDKSGAGDTPLVNVVLRNPHL